MASNMHSPFVPLPWIIYAPYKHDKIYQSEKKEKNRKKEEKKNTAMKKIETSIEKDAILIFNNCNCIWFNAWLKMHGK